MLLENRQFNNLLTHYGELADFYTRALYAQVYHINWEAYINHKPLSYEILKNFINR